jgi:hypothetical protein
LAQILELISFFNRIGQQLPKSDGSIEQLVILQRRQRHRDGTIVPQRIIVHQNNRRVRFMLWPPVDDAEIGRDLDMYPPNADYFACRLHDFGYMTFSIWEACNHALFYAETWNENFLSDQECAQFLCYCKEKVKLWNTAMEKLGLVYRFYGTMETNVAGKEVRMTEKYFGRTGVGCHTRATVEGTLPLKATDSRFPSERRIIDQIVAAA